MINVSKPSLGIEEVELVKNVFDSNWLGSGAEVIEFENRLKDFIGSNNIVTVNSGTAALHLALEASGIKTGDEVIVPSLTFCASVQAITMTGAKPVFCEVSPDSLCIDPNDVRRLITSRTRAVMPVHFAGRSADMDEINNICKGKNIIIVEDAAQAFGSSCKGSIIGSNSKAACFSFDPIKNITCGEGGAISTIDNEIASLIRKKRTLGIDRESWVRHIRMNQDYEVTTQGYRYHLSNINAAIGLAQLKKAGKFRSSKITIVERYNSAFSVLENISTFPFDPEETFPFMYTIKVCGEKRDGLMQFLKDKGISTSINYTPNHLQPFFLNGQRLPVTEKLFSEILTLPLFVDMTEAEIQYVIDGVKDYLR